MYTLPQNVNYNQSNISNNITLIKLHVNYITTPITMKVYQSLKIIKIHYEDNIIKNHHENTHFIRIQDYKVASYQMTNI